MTTIANNQSLTTRQGNVVPALGLGTWKMADGSAYPAVKSAIEMGYRHIDCAWIYGNQEAVGKAINQSIQSQQCSRDELWITSKLWNDRHRPEHVVPAIKETLQQLGLERLDLYLMHWPIAQREGVAVPESADDFLSLDEVPLVETWQALQECQQQGLTREIGVSNFSIKKLQQVLENCSIPPAANQVESHPLLPQNDLVNFCKENQILYTAYSPLGSPDRPDRSRQESDPVLLENEVINQIAGQHDATAAQVTLAWAVQRGTIAIPKSCTPENQKQNLLSQQIELSSEDMQAINDLDQHYRLLGGQFWASFNAGYTLSNLWDE